MMILVSEKKLDIKYFTAKKDDIRFNQVDISLAKNELRYYPKCELTEGIKYLLE